MLEIEPLIHILIQTSLKKFSGILSSILTNTPFGIFTKISSGIPKLIILGMIRSTNSKWDFFWDSSRGMSPIFFQEMSPMNVSWIASGIPVVFSAGISMISPINPSYFFF